MVGLGFGLGVTTVGSRVLLTSLAALSQALVSQIESGELATSTYNWDTTAIFKDDGTGNPAVGDDLADCTILDSSQFGGKTAAQWIAGLTELLSNTSMTVSGVENDTDAEEFIVVSGETYRVEVQWSSKTASGHARVRNSFAGAGSVIQDTGNDTVVDTETYVFEATSSGTWHVELLLRGTGGISATVSVKHLPGNHTVLTGTGPTLLDEFNRSAPALTDNGERGPNLIEGKSPTLSSGWVDNGDGSFTVNGSSFSDMEWLDLPLEPGSHYVLELEIYDYVSGSLGCFLGSSGGGDVNVQWSGVGTVEGGGLKTSDALQYTPQGPPQLLIRGNGAGGSFEGKIRGITLTKVLTAFDERGPELVSSSADWAFAGDSTGLVISSDGKTITSDGTLSGTGNSIRLLPNSIDPGIYEMTFDADQDSGADILDASASVYTNITAGSHKVLIEVTALGVNAIRVRPTDPFELSNISVKKVIYPNLVTNGTFDADSDWTKGTGWTIGSGVATAVNGANLAQLGTLTLNRWYALTFYISSYTSGTLYAGTTTSNQPFNSSGWKTMYFRADQTAFYFLGLNSFNGTIDNVSVQEVPASIPRLYYTETNGTDDALTMALPARRNLLINSEDLSQSSWIKAGVTVSAASEGYEVLAPSGTGHRRFYVNRPTATGPATWYMDVSAGTHDTFQLYNGGSANSLATFDLTTGAVVHEGSETNASITDLGGGVYRCIATFTRTDLTGAYWFGLAPKGATSYGHQLNSDQDETIIVHRGQLETGSTATDYQSIGSDWMDDMMVSIAFRTSDTQGILIDGQNASYWMYPWESGSTSTAFANGAGSPGLYIDGVLFTGTTRGDLSAALADGDWHVATVVGGDLSLWTEVVLGFFNSSDNYNSAYDVVGLVIAPNTTENIELAEAALAEAMEPVGYAI
jgi:hypothetical protein